MLRVDDVGAWLAALVHLGTGPAPGRIVSGAGPISASICSISSAGSLAAATADQIACECKRYAGIRPERKAAVGACRRACHIGIAEWTPSTLAG